MIDQEFLDALLAVIPEDHPHHGPLTARIYDLFAADPEPDPPTVRQNTIRSFATLVRISDKLAFLPDISNFTATPSGSLGFFDEWTQDAKRNHYWLTVSPTGSVTYLSKISGRLRAVRLPADGGLEEIAKRFQADNRRG